MLIVFKGKKSQTGLATIKEFPDICFSESHEEFDEIERKLENNETLAILPIWNSHEGEIIKSQVLNLLFENKAKLYRVWPKQIQFECLSKVRSRSKIRKIVSIGVAATQCSQFVKKTRAKFISASSTPEAYKQFCKEKKIDAALCAPGQNEGHFFVLCQDAANPLNFTSFVLLGCLNSKNWSKANWGSFYSHLQPLKNRYLGVQMPIPALSSEDQETLFSELTQNATTIDRVPKVLFVTKGLINQCRLLIEADKNILLSDVLNEEGYSSEIEINVDIGHSNLSYPIRINDFLNTTFSTLVRGDFIRHIGTQTCFFACPSLGIVTHGFEDIVVEPVVKRIILKHFELIDKGIGCTEIQKTFFKKYKKVYYDKGVEFIKFTDVGL
jgi:hypothetical protein